MSQRFLAVCLSLSIALACGIALGVGSTHARAGKPTTLATADDPTEEIVKRHIIKGEEKLTKYSSGPKSVTVTFEGVRFGQARTATRSDEDNGVPRGGTVHPVRVRYTSVHHYSNTDEEHKYHNEYDFYRDSFGEWAALGRGPVK